MRSTALTLFAWMIAASGLLAQDYHLEIWEVNILDKQGGSYLELDIYNNGDTFPPPYIQVLLDEEDISNGLPEPQNSLLAPKSLRRFEMPINLPEGYEKGKLKLTVVVGHANYQFTKKVKVRM